MRIIDVIDHTNVAQDELTYREPQQGSGDWRFGSQVIVNESQAAVFARGGEVLDALGPGRHTLSTANLPILSGLIGLATSGRTPFTADLYFVNLKDMPQVGWGTNPPIVLETPGRGFGVVLLQGNGVIDISIDDPVRFVKQYGVGRAQTRLSDIRDRIQAVLLGELTTILALSKAESVPAVNGLLGDLEGGLLAKINEKFQALGMRIKAFESNPFRAKEDVTLDEIRNYVTAEAYERYMNERRLGIAGDAARNQGVGGALAGAGVGFGVGQQLGSVLNPDQAAMQQRMMEQQLLMQQMMMNQMQQPQPSAPNTPPAAETNTNPQTKADIQALLDSLDAQLVSGKISEATYNRLIEKWQKRLDEMG